MPASLFGPLLASNRKSGGRNSKSRGSGAFSSATSGRSGVSSQGGKNASSSVFQFTDTLSAATTKTYVLSSDDDFIAAHFYLSVTATGNSTSADILNGISQLVILAPDGPIITMQPQPDFNLFAQRFGIQHKLPTQNVATGATAVTGDYVVYGLNLPKSKGPYSMMITTPAAASFNTSTSALSVAVTVELTVGKCHGQRTRYVYSGLPITPAASGVNDLAPLAPIQDADLVEIFFTGLTSNTSTGDISYIQLQSQGGVLGPRITGGYLVSKANGEMYSSLYSSAESVGAGSTGTTPTLFLLFPLGSTLQLGRSAHCYLNWNATPSSTIRNGYYWLD